MFQEAKGPLTFHDLIVDEGGALAETFLELEKFVIWP